MGTILVEYTIPSERYIKFGVINQYYSLKTHLSSRGRETYGKGSHQVDLHLFDQKHVQRCVIKSTCELS